MKQIAAALSFSMLGAPALAAELVMFEEPGCYYCLEWKQDIGISYAKTAEGKRAPLRMVQLFEDRPADLKEITGVNYTPTFILVDNGEEVGRIVGYPGEHFFWPLLNRLLDKLPEQRAAIE